MGSFDNPVDLVVDMVEGRRAISFFQVLEYLADVFCGDRHDPYSLLNSGLSLATVPTMCAVRPRCGILRLRGRGRLETTPTPCGSMRFRDRVPKPPQLRPIGSSRGKPPSRW